MKSSVCVVLLLAVAVLLLATFVSAMPAGGGQQRVCTPNESYKQDCNTCVCNAEGTNAACTLKFCL